MEERQIGKQGEGNRNNEEEEGGSDGEKRAAWRTKKGDREDQEEKRIGRAGHLFFVIHSSFSSFLTLFSRASLTPFFHSLRPSVPLSISYPLSSSPSFLFPCSFSSFLRSPFYRVHSMSLSSSVPFVIT